MVIFTSEKYTFWDGGRADFDVAEIQMTLRISSVLGLMKHVTSKVKTVKEGAHLVRPFSILSRRKSRLPLRFRPWPGTHGAARTSTWSSQVFHHSTLLLILVSLEGLLTFPATSIYVRK